MRAPFTVVIPARFASTRLPGKPLVEIAGKPMIQHVYERSLASGASEVIVATDDERVRIAGEEFGARVEMTSSAHRCGTERAAEVASRLDHDSDWIVVNIQGDEPLIPPRVIAQVASNLADRPGVDMATVCERVRAIADVFDPAVVKVVFDRHGHALYFSRAPIPWYRDHFDGAPGTTPPDARHFRHIGIYAYRIGFLHEYLAEPACELERAESLEQLRALHRGARIHVAEALERPGPGVDTADDLERVRLLLGPGG